MAEHYHRVERLPVTLDGEAYAVDPEGYTRTTVPVLREQFDSSAEAGEQRLNTQMWVRHQTDWSLGAGQEFLDNSDSDRRRFFTSAGVDVWTKGRAKMLPICESKNNAKVWTAGIMRRFGAYVYAAVGTELFYSANFASADGSVTWTQVTPLASPQTISSITSDGATVFIAYNATRALAYTGIGVNTQPSSLGSTTPDWIEVVGGKLISGDANVLTELNAAGAATGITTTLVHAGATWVTSCVGPVGIYAAANTDKGSIYFVPVAATDGLLDTAMQVAELPVGETINDMTSYGGFVMLATSKGFRLAAVDTQSGSITYGPVIDKGGEAFSLATDGRFVWWGTSAGVTYRADLSQFTDTLVPAYASDLVSVGDGNSLGNVTAIARFANVTYLWDTGNGVQGEESTGALVATATLCVGQVRWNSQFSKVLRTVESRSAPTVVAGGNVAYDASGVTYDDVDTLYNGLAIPVAGTLQVQFTDDDGIVSDLKTLVNKSQTTVTPTFQSHSFTPDFTFARDGDTTSAGPQLESWAVEAFPAPTRIDEIVLPLMLQRRVATSRGMGAATTVRTQGGYDALRAMMVAKSVVMFKEGSRSEFVVVDQLSLQPEKMSDDGDWWEGVLTVRLLTVP